jgi:hypothetical protein
MTLLPHGRMQASAANAAAAAAAGPTQAACMKGREVAHQQGLGSVWPHSALMPLGTVAASPQSRHPCASQQVQHFARTYPARLGQKASLNMPCQMQSASSTTTNTIAHLHVGCCSALVSGYVSWGFRNPSTTKEKLLKSTAQNTVFALGRCAMAQEHQSWSPMVRGDL